MSLVWVFAGIQTAKMEKTEKTRGKQVKFGQIAGFMAPRAVEMVQWRIMELKLQVAATWMIEFELGW